MITNPLNTQNSMTLNEMKAELIEMEVTAAEMAPYVHEGLAEKINEMREMIVEWEAELSKIGW